MKDVYKVSLKKLSKEELEKINAAGGLRPVADPSDTEKAAMGWNGYYSNGRHYTDMGNK